MHPMKESSMRRFSHEPVSLKNAATPTRATSGECRNAPPAQLPYFPDLDEELQDDCYSSQEAKSSSSTSSSLEDKIPMRSHSDVSHTTASSSMRPPLSGKMANLNLFFSPPSRHLEHSASSEASDVSDADARHLRFRLRRQVVRLLRDNVNLPHHTVMMVPSHMMETIEDLFRLEEAGEALPTTLGRSPSERIARYLFASPYAVYE